MEDSLASVHVSRIDDASTQAGRPRQRSSIACQSCHNRRVKCNAARQGLPCSNCRRSNRQCCLIDSRRNHKSRQRVVKPGQSPSASASTSEEPAPRISHLVSAAAAGEPIPNHCSGEERSASHPAHEGPESLYAKMLDAGPTNGLRDTSRPGGNIMYLGETFNLTYLVQQTATGPRAGIRKLHYPLPLDIARRAKNQNNQDETNAIVTALRAQGAFTLPLPWICRELFRVYFKYVQPHYPILDRPDFARRYADQSNPPSYLLLQSVILMAVGHCEEHILKEMGFKSRYEARLIIFKRAKALYDADYESDKVTIIQSIFLMSFWWNSPMDQKDTWHWLGAAISLAITLGMHRSTRLSDMNTRDQSLWKKIWWSLFIEDKHAAAALGRPVHIHLKDCDVEILSEIDFKEEACVDTAVFGQQERVDTLYVIQLCKLSRIVEQIIEAHREASTDPSGLQACGDLLRAWETSLPLELQSHHKEFCLWTNTLHIAYNWFRVLTHRTPSKINDNTTAGLRTSTQHLASTAANQIFRLVEELLSTNHIRHCPIHVVPSLFAAMGMHAVEIGSGDALREQLGFVKIELSMIALREVQDTWPVGGWIFLLFSRILRRIHDSEHLSSRLCDKGLTPGTRAPINSGSGSRHRRKDESEPINVHENRCEQDISEVSHFENPASAMFYFESQPFLVPMNYPTDWDEVIRDDTWIDTGFDISADTSR